MKCFNCSDEVNQDSESYSFNYQASGIKFYGLMWCAACGAEVMEALKKLKVMGRK